MASFLEGAIEVEEIALSHSRHESFRISVVNYNESAMIYAGQTLFLS